MQDRPLMISDILRFAESAHRDREIVSRLVDEPDWRYDYGALAERCRRGANMLRGLGVRAGDRVTSLAWNTHRHMELFYAVPGIGAILHTANPRFSLDQIAYTIEHAGSRVVLYDRSFADLIDDLRERLPAVERYVLLCDDYEALLTEASPLFAWPVFDENAGSFLCYTSGTTGDPKGVLYSHRSVVIHALAAGLNGALGFTAFDCIMPCQSLYHATAWGLPFVAAINGCKMVLPCHRFDGESLQQLIEAEGVTFSGGVPTIWTMYLDHLERSGETAGSLKQLVIGGSAVPRAMAEAFESRYGVTVRQIWGMTETSPLGVLSTPTPKLAALAGDALGEAIWSRSGRLQFGIETRIVDDAGCEVPADGQTAGVLLVRGPWVVERYYRSDSSACDAEGWFDTGDIATLDDCGFVRITDRSKDVIKSGGEWISSIDLENVAISCPGVKIAAVVGVAHPKWEERPILVLECHPGEAPSEAAVRAHLAPHMPHWWQPDAIVYAEVPLTSTGKIDKKLLRERYKDHLTPGARLQTRSGSD
jgi:fatty-acyl-CoA synthase